MSDNNKAVGVTQDWWIAGMFIGLFFILLKTAGWIDQLFDFSAIFNIVDFSVVAAKVAFASALAWTVKKLVFKNTLGRDFGVKFNEGWNSMTTTEKTRWILVIFSMLFVSIMASFP